MFPLLSRKTGFCFQFATGSPKKADINRQQSKIYVNQESGVAGISHGISKGSKVL
jgi:hypothetical protein